MALGDGKRGWLGTESVGCLESCPGLPAPLRLASLAPPGPPGLWSSLVPPCFCRPLLFGSPFSTLHFLSSTSSPALSKQNHLCSIGFSGKSFLDLSLIIALEQRTHSSQAPPLWAWSPALGWGRADHGERGSIQRGPQPLLPSCPAGGPRVDPSWASSDAP